MQISIATMEKSMRVLSKLKTIPPRGMYLKTIKSTYQRAVCTSTFTVALFTIGKN